MSKVEVFVLSTVMILHAFFAFRYTKKILDSPRLKIPQKRINSAMVWLIPFLWYQMIKSLLEPSEVMTKNKRSGKKSFPTAAESEYVDNF